MFTDQVERLAFAQFVVEETALQGFYVTHFEPYLPIVPDDFRLIATDCAVGQDVYLWADEFDTVLYLVLPGIGLFAAEWCYHEDEQLHYHPALGVVAGA